MAQDRKNIFGALIETEDMPRALSALSAPGRLEGMDFSVSAADLLQVSAGSCILPDGVVILEDEDREILVNNSSFAADYTVIYQLEDVRVLGGSPAQLRLLAGIHQQDDFTDSTVLGWIKYPGGSIPLSESHFIQPASIRLGNVLGKLDAVYLPPFVEAIRPQTELRGSLLAKSLRQSNLSSNYSVPQSFFGRTRVVGASVIADAVSIAENNSNYDSFAVKRAFVVTGDTASGSNVINNVSDTSRIILGQSISGSNIPSGSTVTNISGSSVTISGVASSLAVGISFTLTDILFTYDTRAANQGEVTAGVTSEFVKSSLATSRFILEPTDHVKVENVITGSPTASSGEIVVVGESPASSGNWQEQIQNFSFEPALKFLNISTSTTSYVFKIPFVISGDRGQPLKLVSRLHVDFNAIVTFKIIADNQTLTLSPASGAVANTGSLLTRELSIPKNSTVNWVAGKTALIEVTIDAQPGGSASFAYIGLTSDSASSLIFI